MADTLRIDAEDLILALENHSYEMEYFIDLKTGEIIIRTEEGVFGSEDEFEGDLDEQPGLFCRVDPIPSSTAFEIMADFIDQLPNGMARDDLVRAVRKSHPFRSFKNTLLYHPKIRENWFVFHERAMIKIARDWLKEEGIGADLILPLREVSSDVP